MNDAEEMPTFSPDSKHPEEGSRSSKQPMSPTHGSEFKSPKRRKLTETSLPSSPQMPQQKPQQTPCTLTHYSISNDEAKKIAKKHANFKSLMTTLLEMIVWRAEKRGEFTDHELIKQLQATLNDAIVLLLFSL